MPCQSANMATITVDTAPKEWISLHFALTLRLFSTFDYCKLPSGRVLTLAKMNHFRARILMPHPLSIPCKGINRHITFGQSPQIYQEHKTYCVFEKMDEISKHARHSKKKKKRNIWRIARVSNILRLWLLCQDQQ